MPAYGGARSELEQAFPDHQQLAGRDDVHGLGSTRVLSSHFPNRHRGRPSENLRQHALVRGIQVLDDDERHAGVGGQVRQKRPQRFEAASRCADAHDWKGGGLPGDQPRLGTDEIAGLALIAGQARSPMGCSRSDTACDAPDEAVCALQNRIANVGPRDRPSRRLQGDGSGGSLASRITCPPPPG